MSFAQEVATLDDDARKAFLANLDDAQIEEFLYGWKYWARPEQLTPPGDWNAWLYLAGRGAGKTRTDAEDVKAYGLAHPGRRIAIVAPTYGDARDTCIEGDSGLLGILPKKYVATWNRSLGELILTNGTKYKLFSADEPERLRGPQHHRAWCEELCAWRYVQDAWDNLMFGLRLGIKPQVVISTTPKPIKFLVELMQRKDVYVTRGNTFDNAANLAPAALAALKERYLGTRKGRQELFAEILDDNPGALWKREWIESGRIRWGQQPEFKRVVVAVDPAVKSPDEAKAKRGELDEAVAETGIIVVGLGLDDHGYVLADLSMQGKPLEWAEEVVRAYDLYKADMVVGEVNNGGDLVESNVHTVRKNLPFKAVHASRGKQIRAEPVSSLYQQQRAHHVGTFPDLEDQQCSWEAGMRSPDRLDGNVWGLTELMLDPTKSADERIAELKSRKELDEAREQQKKAQHAQQPERRPFWQ